MSVGTFKEKYNKYYLRDIIKRWVDGKLGLKDNQYYRLHWFFEYGIKEDIYIIGKLLDEIETPEEFNKKIKRIFRLSWHNFKAFLVKLHRAMTTNNDDYE